MVSDGILQTVYCISYDQAESRNHTSCACANHPPENVTAPGWHIREGRLMTKFFLYTRQFGADFPGTFFRTDACSNSEMLRVPRRNAVCINVQIPGNHWNLAGSLTCCLIDSNPGRYHRTIRPLESTIVRGSV